MGLPCRVGSSSKPSLDFGPMERWDLYLLLVEDMLLLLGGIPMFRILKSTYGKMRSVFALV